MYFALAVVEHSRLLLQHYGAGSVTASSPRAGESRYSQWVCEYGNLSIKIKIPIYTLKGVNLE